MARTGYCLARVLVILVGSPFFAGVLLAGANALSKTPQVSDLLLGLKRYGLVLLASLMTYLCGIGVMIISLLPLPLFAVVAYVIGACGRQGVGLAAGVSGVGMIVTGAIWLVAYGLIICRLMFAPAIAADPTIGCISAMDAMRRIWSMTSPQNQSVGHGPVMLVAFIIVALSFLLLCVEYGVVCLPVFILMANAAYTLLFRSGENTTGTG